MSSASDSSLVSPAVTLNGNSNQQISFRHRYTTQTSQGIGYDGVLEISVAGTFAELVTAGGSRVQGGYGVPPPAPTDPSNAGDLDGDGVSNRAEFLAGTDPTNGPTMSFPTLAGRTYQLGYKNALTDAAWTPLPDTYNGDGITFNVLFSPTDLNNQPRRFYRLRVFRTDP